MLTGVLAGFPPTPEGVTILKSKFHPGVKISYKNPGICETTPGVNSYSGYVHLPPNTTGPDQNYPINTFFWFFESRHDPHNAPLAIWMNGGPGSSSMVGLFTENGPCRVNNDSASTHLNPWSWNNEVNMLYIDQPNQVGFSYDVPSNATFDYDSETLNYSDFGGGVPGTNNTFAVGTFPSGKVDATVNTTSNAAHAMWYFVQTWFGEFPEYTPNDNKISIWTESYGGRYGPAFTAFFEKQNEKIRNGDGKYEGAVDLHLGSLGIVNGCIDILAQEPAYPEMAYNNTYGLQLITEAQYNSALEHFHRPKGCKDQIVQCQRLAKGLDPDNVGDVEQVNKACRSADHYCLKWVEGVYLNHAGRSYYDIAHSNPESFPPGYYLGYLVDHEVQRALGVPVNYTQSVDSVYKAFSRMSPFYRGGLLEDIGYLLDRGIKVALVFGDRDYACNWIGGETASLAVNYTHTPAFHSAGYTNLTTNATYVGGQVRQHANFSFTRVFQAGHEVPAYQPETALEIFMRTLRGQDLATGTIKVDGEYKTTGPSSTFLVRDVPPEDPAPTCYILAPESCEKRIWKSVKEGRAAVKDYVVVGEGGGVAGEGVEDRQGRIMVSGRPQKGKRIVVLK
ncbi:putative carboxypeptidase S1 [Choiromyces venosus 120613-1]|uniref:Putative carboxypeptidase S1 n=1 Tax=Choiromyces venosus 120613-1 TaxID=1336337 RepID=A0A3N4JLC6_9PEZI|nr:putative carboxypeptidase S1 [Choiromyces venosus 120613-1]